MYALRYTDDLPIGFNLVIASREFLAEMDFTIASMFSCFSMQQGNRQIETPYQIAVRTKDDRLRLENHVLSKVPAELFTYSKPQFVYEVRSHDTRGLMEVTYVANGQPKRAGFCGQDGCRLIQWELSSISRLVHLNCEKAKPPPRDELRVLSKGRGADFSSIAAVARK